MNQRLRRLPSLLPAALAFAVAGSGCAGDESHFPGPPPASEAGAPPRTISNVTPGGDRTDGGRLEADAPVSVGDAAGALRVTVAIASPMAGALVPAETRFAPPLNLKTVDE